MVLYQLSYACVREEDKRGRSGMVNRYFEKIEKTYMDSKSKSTWLRACVGNGVTPAAFKTGTVSSDSR